MGHYTWYLVPCNERSLSLVGSSNVKDALGSQVTLEGFVYQNSSQILTYNDFASVAGSL
jgi:hypothetical protein